ncbi:hypothetical protein [Weissella viridescens]|uniref:hypothetical protein n=1 Tax=Weissella viridescens TaxID=1629 RepID=UPI003AF269D5
MKLSKKMIAILCSVVVIVGGVIFVSTRPHSALKDVKMTYSGYNGRGRYDYVDKHSVNDNLFDILSKRYHLSDSAKTTLKENSIAANPDPKNVASNMMDYYQENAATFTDKDQEAIKKIAGDMRMITVKESLSEGSIKNGDKLNIKVSAPRSTKIKNESRTFKVSGLKKSTVLTNDDLKKHLKVSISGDSGNGKVTVSTDKQGEKYGLDQLPIVQQNSDDLDETYSDDQSNGSLKNGDKVQIYDQNEINEVLPEQYTMKDSANYSIKISDLTDVSKLNYDALTDAGVKALTDDDTFNFKDPKLEAAFIHNDGSIDDHSADKYAAILLYKTSYEDEDMIHDKVDRVDTDASVTLSNIKVENGKLIPSNDEDDISLNATDDDLKQFKDNHEDDIKLK